MVVASASEDASRKAIGKHIKNSLKIPDMTGRQKEPRSPTGMPPADRLSVKTGVRHSAQQARSRGHQQETSPAEEKKVDELNASTIIEKTDAILVEAREVCNSPQARRRRELTENTIKRARRALKEGLSMDEVEVSSDGSGNSVDSILNKAVLKSHDSFLQAVSRDSGDNTTTDTGAKGHQQLPAKSIRNQPTTTDHGNKNSMRNITKDLQSSTATQKPISVDTSAYRRTPDRVEQPRTPQPIRQRYSPPRRPPKDIDPQEMASYRSPIQSMVSADDGEEAIPDLPGNTGHDAKSLKRLDGIASPHAVRKNSIDSGIVASAPSSPVKTVVVSDSYYPPRRVRYEAPEEKKPEEKSVWNSLLQLVFGDSEDEKDTHRRRNRLHLDELVGPMVCAGKETLVCVGRGVDEDVENVEEGALPTSIVRVKSEESDIGYADQIVDQPEKFLADPRMPLWIERQAKSRPAVSEEITYQLGTSRTAITHEINRGDWTWAMAWSPDGKRLAIGTEMHSLAVVETSLSPVWRVKHDQRMPAGKARSIRSIAWGSKFIATSSTAKEVLIYSPIEPYPVVHVIPNTGYVGSLDWCTDKNILLIGSQLGHVKIFRIWASAAEKQAIDFSTRKRNNDIHSNCLHTVDRGSASVDAVEFCPNGQSFAAADSDGILCVYSYTENMSHQSSLSVHVSDISSFKFEAPIHRVNWSSDRQYLYALGKDFCITVINTQWWEIVHRIRSDRGVLCLTSSASGSHLAIGGQDSPLSLLDSNQGWDATLRLKLPHHFTPLVSLWHPRDQLMVVAGQSDKIVAFETTNARHVTGHHLHSQAPILAVEFSPNGRMVAIGNQEGVVTIFQLSGTTFITVYEMVVDCDGALTIKWNRKRNHVYVATGFKFVVVACTKARRLPDRTPPHAFGFRVVKVQKAWGKVHAMAVCPRGDFVAVCGEHTRIVETNAYTVAREFLKKPKTTVDPNRGVAVTLAAAFSFDRSWLATIGQGDPFTVYDTASERLLDWRPVFTVETDLRGTSLAWGPPGGGGLQYCAYGGEEKNITLMEIRGKERTWEIILVIPREGIINDLSWNSDGLLAAARDNGTVTVVDTSYLQVGVAANEMDYTWQRQALTCFTEIRRNQGSNAMTAVQWLPAAPGSDTLLAVGGTDGELEILDLTERQRCSGFMRS